mmetsp:Transcript_85812/g.229585  ORF Transcript_85812/g.229585 Transcript_85812/m.229585 type:complete len:112 (-) Transcript_85812:1782-2117(-)
MAMSSQNQLGTVSAKASKYHSHSAETLQRERGASIPPGTAARAPEQVADTRRMPSAVLHPEAADNPGRSNTAAPHALGDCRCRTSQLLHVDREGDATARLREAGSVRAMHC